VRAMVLRATRQPLTREEREPPPVGPGEIQVRVRACGVCRTDLHFVDGELPPAPLPRIPGHEVVGTVSEVGPGVDKFHVGERVGLPWLGFACGVCVYCRAGRENLCDRAQFTGYTRDGGYAEYTAADARFAFSLPDGYSDIAAAPLLCAGMIGFRSLRLAGDARRIGLYGFGAAAHIIAQVAVHRGSRVYAFTRPGDARGQEFARSLGATWAGGSDESPPERLDAALIFAPVGPLVPVALAATDKGGVVVCAGIHMSDIPSFPYERIWEERVVRSVANLTREDGEEFLREVSRRPVRTVTTPLPLSDANEALRRLRAGELEGAAVLTVGSDAAD
jgi:alcohol dehydrogenase, propanol-preferring